MFVRQRLAGIPVVKYVLEQNIPLTKISSKILILMIAVKNKLTEQILNEMLYLPDQSIILT